MKTVKVYSKYTVATFTKSVLLKEFTRSSIEKKLLLLYNNTLCPYQALLFYFIVSFSLKNSKCYLYLKVC